MQNNFKLFLLFSSITISIILACGTADEANTTDLKNTPQKNALNLNSNSGNFPTEENYGQWKKYWDKETWIVALNKSTLNHTPHTLKNSFLAAVQKEFNFNGTEYNWKSIENYAQHNLSIQIENLKYAFAQKQWAGNTITGFAFLAIKNQATFWPMVNKLSPLHISNFIFDKSISNQYAIFAKMPEVAWAEPNLSNDLFQTTVENPIITPTPSTTPTASSSATSTPTSTATSTPTPTATPIINSENTAINVIHKRIGADVAWNYVKTNKLPLYEINVAVIDTGVDSEHPSLKNQMYVNEKESKGYGNYDDDQNGYIDDIHGFDATFEPGYSDFGPKPTPGSADLGGPGKACPPIDSSEAKSQSCGHGTHVAGLIAAKDPNMLYGPGICPSCKIISLRVTKRFIKQTGEEYDGKIDDASQVRALTYILNLTSDGYHLITHIVNLSIGKYFQYRSMSFLIQNLYENGVLVIAAAGNENTETPSYPAAYSTVMSVCALSHDGMRGNMAKAAFSNFGDWVDICTPGTNIMSTIPGGSKESKSGTSQASPITAGAAAFLKSVYPGISNVEIMNTLRLYANDKIYIDPMNEYFTRVFSNGRQFHLLGAGLLNVGAAISKDTSNLSYVSRLSGREYEWSLTHGCVAASIGSKQFTYDKISHSFPFLCSLIWLIYFAIKTLTNRYFQSYKKIQK